VIAHFVDIGGIDDHHSDCHQFHQYQENEQSPLNSDGHQFHQYQENEQSPLNSDGHQFHQYQENEFRGDCSFS
jgi:hypothetical protein